MKDIVIFGTGEYAELAHYYFENDPECDFNVIGFVADDEYVDRDTFRGLPLVKLSDLTRTWSPKDYSAHVALSYSKLNQVKQEKFNTMKELGYELVS